MRKFSYLFAIFLLSNSGYADNVIKTAPVSGFARNFITDAPISDATIRVLETKQMLKTNHLGEFGPLLYPIGQQITLEFSKAGFKTTQSETVRVPRDGLTGPYRNITFQVPSLLTYYAMAKIVGAHIDEHCCHVATTITAYHKTLHDLPQGVSGATVVLTPSADRPPFYFDIFKTFPLKNKTNPFTKYLMKTSEDGGVLFFNLTPRSAPYVLTAKKPGAIFSQTVFQCRAGVFINISPPRGPSILSKQNPQREVESH